MESKNPLVITDGDHYVCGYPQSHSPAGVAHLSLNISPDDVLTNRGAAFAFDADRPDRLSAPTEPRASTQEILPIWGAMLFCIASAVSISYALHNRTNGSMVSLIHGSMADQKLFTVSIYPERAIEFWERPSWQELFDFAKANLDLLLKPGHTLGTWFNDFECVHVADVVVCISDRATALDLGLRAGQWAVFDLEARREIPISRDYYHCASPLANNGKSCSDD